MTSSSRIPALSMACLLALGGATAHAQAQADKAPRGERMEKAHAEMQKRFDAADTNKDGKLSAEEAKAGMPMVAKNFEAIDTGHHGAVSMADIQAFAQSKRASRKTAN